MHLDELNIITTKDGGHSIFNSALNEHYHSVHGSVNESQHVFINAGLNKILEQKKEHINILEVGLGTGLNVLLTISNIQNNNTQTNIQYTAIEPFPLNTYITNKLNYPEIITLKNSTTIFNTIHNSSFNSTVLLFDHFIFIKHKLPLQQITFTNRFDLIYFDAFAPRVQPELWETTIFKKLFENMNTGAVLVTYCAKGEVKRNLKIAGFEVETLPGPPGKREMTRAIKI